MSAISDVSSGNSGGGGMYNINGFAHDDGFDDNESFHNCMAFMTTTALMAATAFLTVMRLDLPFHHAANLSSNHTCPLSARISLFPALNDHFARHARETPDEESSNKRKFKSN